MSKKILSLVIIALLTMVTANAHPALAQQTTSQQPTTVADRTRACALRLSTRRYRRITVRLRNGSRMRGDVMTVEENHFTIVNNGTVTPVPFDEVVHVQCGRSVRREILKGAIGFALVITGGMLLAVFVASQTR